MKKIILIALISTIFLLSGCTETTTGEAFQLTRPQFKMETCTPHSIDPSTLTNPINLNSYCVTQGYKKAGSGAYELVLYFYDTNNTTCSGNIQYFTKSSYPITPEQRIDPSNNPAAECRTERTMYSPFNARTVSLVEPAYGDIEQRANITANCCK
jgi:hypothetical protein